MLFFQFRLTNADRAAFAPAPSSQVAEPGNTPRPAREKWDAFGVQSAEKHVSGAAAESQALADVSGEQKVNFWRQPIRGLPEEEGS